MVLELNRKENFAVACTAIRYKILMLKSMENSLSQKAANELNCAGKSFYVAINLHCLRPSVAVHPLFGLFLYDVCTSYNVRAALSLVGP